MFSLYNQLFGCDCNVVQGTFMLLFRATQKLESLVRYLMITFAGYFNTSK